MIVGREFHFEAAHYLPGHPKCEALHGHSYQLTVMVDGPVDLEHGMVLDFHALDEIVGEHILRKVDHQCLNAIDEIVRPPTAENLLLTFARWLRPAMQQLTPVHLYGMTLYETARNFATLYMSDILVPADPEADLIHAEIVQPPTVGDTFEPTTGEPWRSRQWTS